MTTICLRVDVDTSVGLAKGVPRLLKLFASHGVPATFFVVMGPDTMGKHVKRFRKPGYWRRIFAVNPLRLLRSYGLRPFLYGTLLRSPEVGSGHPEVLRHILDDGHELGLHGWDHARWADHHDTLTAADVRAEIDACARRFREITGVDPATSACPNWRCNDLILSELDSYGFHYQSDVRGHGPFFPLVEGNRLDTLQVPQTLPCAHECLQAGSATRETVAGVILDQIVPGAVNVHTVHDWLEGLSGHSIMVDFIEGALARGYRFARMTDVADEILTAGEGEVAASPVVMRSARGGIGDVAWQADHG